MPQLSDLIKQRPDKKFKKKEYRSWDLSGKGIIDNSPNHTEPCIVPAETGSLPPPLEDTTVSINTGNIIDNNSDNISDNVQITNKTSDNKKDNIQITHIEHVDNIKDNKLDNSTDNVLDNVENTIFLTDSIRKLSGIQRKIFFYIIDLCSSRGQLQSNPILTNDLAEIADCSFGSAKTSLIRLINKNLLIRKKGKASKGGYIILAITKEIQTAALQAQRFNLNKYKELYTGNTIGNTSNNILDNNSLTNSSSIYINTTTYADAELPEDWLEINIGPLSEINFTIKQLKQLFKLKITTPEIVQESINHFSFGLKNNLKFKNYNDPLNVLMGVLRKGDVWVEANYESPQEIAQRALIELKKAERERKNQLEQEAFQLSFMDWKESLNTEELELILVKDNPKDFTPDEIKLKAYFKKNIWLGVKKNYLVDGIE